jgi:ATP-dependent helicase HrpA
MLKEKILALLKSLPQKPRSRFVPLPESAERLSAQFTAAPPRTGLLDALLRQVRDSTSLDVKRNDFKLDMLKAHLFMNFRVVDEHGRQLGIGRNLAALKAELGGQARGAFQALAALRVASLAPVEAVENEKIQSNQALTQYPRALQAIKNEASATATGGLGGAGGSDKARQAAAALEKRYTGWSFGELPELMEIKSARQTMIGFPALIDQGDAVTIEVFDEPAVAAARHRLGLARLFALQIKDALKYLEKNIPDLQPMGVQFMQVGRAADGTGGGTVDELRAQIIAVALDRAFLAEPLPANEVDFKRRTEEGRQRLTLIANEVARLCASVLLEFASAQRKLKDNRNLPVAAAAVADATQQLQRLMPKRFLAQTPWTALQHGPRYLKAITLRLDKLRADPARDAERQTELRPLEQNLWRLVAERKGVQDERVQAFRWLLEELRVSLFAQELRTPQPVSVKRLEKAWAQLLN